MEKQVFKVGDKVPQAGRYVCTVCGFAIEFLSKHIEKGATFPTCPVCLSGTVGGPKEVDEDFWMLAA